MYITLETAIALGEHIKTKPYYISTPLDQIKELKYPYICVGQINDEFLENSHLYDYSKIFLKCEHYYYSSAPHSCEMGYPDCIRRGYCNGDC